MFDELDHPLNVVCPTCKEFTDEDRIHEMVEFPVEIANRWNDILKATGKIELWFDDYSNGFVTPEDDGIPVKAPLIVHDGIITEGNPPVNHYQFGTYCVFRCTNEIHNEFMKIYDNEQSDNEHFIPDGDHMIVVYML